MIIVFTKSQLALFDAPVHVAQHVRRDGTVVAPHVRIQKIAAKPPAAARPHAQGDKPATAWPFGASGQQSAPKPAKRSKLDAFIERKGGVKELGRTLASMTEGQQQRLFAEMARLDGITPEQVADRFGDLAAAPTPQPDMLSRKPAAHGDTVTMPREEAIAEHERLVQVLESPSRNDDKAEAKRQAAELAEYKGEKPSEESDQDRSNREWLENWNRVSGAEDLNTISVSDIRRAINFASHQVARLGPGKAWDGDEGAKKLIEAYNREIENLQFHLKHRGETAAPAPVAEPEKPKAKRARKPKAKAPAPAPATEAQPAPEPATAPASPAHDPSAPFGVAAGIGKQERRDLNAKVIARLEQGGPYTATDLELLRQYSGNGGCGDSLNEYYTDQRVAAATWSVVQSLGITHGDFLEPSVGTGVFLHTAPAGFRGTGVELDPVSAKVAAALHGDRHEVHTASLERFATMDDRQFDVVIGNPPYGPRGFLAKDDKKYISSAEDYSVDTAIDKAKPGGVIALVVPTGILDSKSRRSFREGILCRAEFLGAQRMPNTAFEHSHTEVTTDVVFLRKRPDDVGRALMTVSANGDQHALQELGVWDEEFLAGTYFTGRGAKNILGTMGTGWRAKAGMGDDITVEGSMAGVPEAIAEFQPDAEGRSALSLTVQQVLEALPEGELRDRALTAAQRPRAYENTAKVGDQKTVDGVTYILQGDPPRWHRVDEFVQAPAIAEAQDLAVEIDKLFTGQALNRPALETAIRAYVEKHGIPADNPDLMTAAMADKKLYRLVGAVDRKGNLSDAVAGRAPRAVEGGFDATAQVMALEADAGDFTAAALAERLGKDREEVEDQLAADSRYATLGDGRWTTMDLYLTGELWPKLDAARAALEAGGGLQDKLRDQVARLEKAIDPKSLEDVEVQINSAFLPLHVIEAYFDWRAFDGPQANEWTKKQDPHKITFADGIYRITGGSSWGDAKLLDKYLNRAGIRQEEDLPKIEAWNREFKDWLCTSPYRDAVEDLYNRKFRGYAPRQYSDAPIDVPGLTTDRDVRSWRWDSLRRSLATGKGIVADDVGLGKTLGGLLLARMAKIQGAANKPIIVVPKSVLANWFSETQTWFPGSRVLSIGANFAYDKNGELVGRDDDATERKRKYHDLTQNDYDFILISEPAFEEIDLDPATKEGYYSQDFWVQRGEALGNAGDKRRKAIREKFEQHLAQREFEDRTDAIWFNELGVDMLIADEMHHQKNLYAAKARFGESPKFLGGQGLSNRALDFNLKTRWIRENNSGKGVYGLTATPTKNSPLEIYSMLSHIAPEAFENIGIRNSEEFLDRFCVFEKDKVLNTRGEIEDALVVSGFKNLNELRPIMARYIDRRTAEQVGLKLPERKQEMHLVDMTPAQQEVYAELRALAEESQGKKDSTGDAHIFSIMDKMNKAALDLELLGRNEHAGASSPKYAELAKHVVEGAKDGGQLVFSEYIDSHEKIKRALVDSGIPAAQIGIINAQVAGSAVKRQNIAEALNKGKLKVVIGNCTMAEGLNMQKTTTDIHELDIPWEPATVQQRLGRGIRQGNLNEAVRTHSYLAKGSFDGYRYQAVHAKRDWMDLLWNGGDRVENLAREGAFSLDDMRIMLAADLEAAKAAFEADKAAAMQRYEAGARSDAQEQYVKFTELSRSYGALKNKDTVSARRLRQRLETAKTSLFNNKYWPDKSALDHAGDVLVHPETGTVVKPGQGFDLGEDGKAVVTGVNMRAGTVTLRKWAATGGSRPATMPLKELATAKPFDHDEAAEATEVERQLTEAAAAKLSSIEKWEDIAAMPPAVVDANRDLIQRQVKEGQAAYKFRMPYGDVPMVHKETGKIEVVPEYNARGMHETHDYLLPTSDAQEKAIQAWIDERRQSKIGTRFEGGGGGRRKSKSYTSAARKYPGASYSTSHVNPLRGVLARLGGDGNVYGTTPRLVKEAKARLEAEQTERIRHAKTIGEAVDAILPLAAVSGRTEGYGSSGFTAKYPKKALTMLWARARHLGQLHVPLHSQERSEHDGYAFAGHADKTVHNALVGMARASGHKDLAEAMVEAEQRDPNSQNNHAQTVSVLGRGFAGDHTRRSLAQLLRAAEKAGLADKTLTQLREHGLRDAFAPSTSYGYYNSAGNSKTLREKVAELMPAGDDTKEAA